MSAQETPQVTRETAIPRRRPRSHGASATELLTALEHERPDLSEAAPVSSAALAAGDLVRRARLAKGMSQAELARLSGLQQSAVSTIERGDGKDGPTFRKLRDLAGALGMSVEFVSKTEEQPRSSSQTALTEESAAISAAQLDYYRSLMANTRPWSWRTEIQGYTDVAAVLHSPAEGEDGVILEAEGDAATGGLIGATEARAVVFGGRETTFGLLGDLERAIASFEDALTALRREDDPQLWARTKANLGEAYLERAAATRAEKVENTTLHSSG